LLNIEILDKEQNERESRRRRERKKKEKRAGSPSTLVTRTEPPGNDGRKPLYIMAMGRGGGRESGEVRRRSSQKRRLHQTAYRKRGKEEI